MGTGEGRGKGSAETAGGALKSWTELSDKQTAATMIRKAPDGKIVKLDVDLDIENGKVTAKDKKTGEPIATFVKGNNKYIHTKDAEGNTISLHTGKIMSAGAGSSSPQPNANKLIVEGEESPAAEKPAETPNPFDNVEFNLDELDLGTLKDFPPAAKEENVDDILAAIEAIPSQDKSVKPEAPNEDIFADLFEDKPTKSTETHEMPEPSPEDIKKKTEEIVSFGDWHVDADKKIQNAMQQDLLAAEDENDTGAGLNISQIATVIRNGIAKDYYDKFQQLKQMAEDFDLSNDTFKDMTDELKAAEEKEAKKLKELVANAKMQVATKAASKKAAKEAEIQAQLKQGQDFVKQSEAEWQKTFDSIKAIREAAGLKDKDLPENVETVVQGQPVSESLYRLTDGGESEFIIENTLKSGLAKVKEEVLKKGGKRAEKKHFDLDLLAEHFDEAIEKHNLDPKQYETLTKAEKAMVVFYTKYGDETMNAHLREITQDMADLAEITDPEDRKKAEQLMGERMLEPEYAEKNAMAHTLMSALAKMPQYNGVVYRGTGIDRLKQMNPGDIMYDGAFMSSTFNEAREGFWGKEGQVAIHLPRGGVDINKFSWFYEGEEAFQNEGEVLIFPGMMNRLDMVTDLGAGGVDGTKFPKEDKKKIFAARQMEAPGKVAEIQKNAKKPGRKERIQDQYKGELPPLSKERLEEAAKEYNTTPEAITGERKNDKTSENGMDYAIEEAMRKLSGNAQKAAEESAR